MSFEAVSDHAGNLDGSMDRLIVKQYSLQNRERLLRDYFGTIVRLAHHRGRD